MIVGTGSKDRFLREEELAELCREALRKKDFHSKKVFGFYAGGEEAWSRASDLSSRVNIKWVDRPFHTVLSIAPRMYEDLWTAGKCMYKLELVVEDRGMLIIYAPHIK